MDYPVDTDSSSDKAFQTPKKMSQSLASSRTAATAATTTDLLERVEHHPLVDAEYYGGSIEPSSSVDTASLIQSAARSIMDDTSPSTAVSEDGSYDHSFTAAHSSATNETYSDTTLRSLQMKTLPTLPDEQDRRRFVVRVLLNEKEISVVHMNVICVRL
jgi:hypothetical protein